jgi:hypothetical protein
LAWHAAEERAEGRGGEGVRDGERCTTRGLCRCAETEGRGGIAL